MPVAAAAVVGLAATAYSADQSRSASNKAADASVKGANSAAQVQQNALDQAQANQTPYRLFGTGSIDQFSANQPIPQTFDNFDWQEYLRQNPDVADPAKWRGHGTPQQAAWAHYQQYGQYEGRPFTPIADAQPYAAADSPMAKYLELLKPENQASYLENNPIFQAALNQFGTKAKNTLGFGGLKGDLANAITQNYVATGNQFVDQQLNRLLQPIQIGQSAASNSASTGLTGANLIANNITDAASARAAGIVGGANAQTAGINSLLNFGSQLAGAYYGNKIPSIGAAA